MIGGDFKKQYILNEFKKMIKEYPKKEYYYIHYAGIATVDPKTK